ncbi:MAG: J domain-containing protein [Desulfobacterales bacterium]|nr:MAG: J domain-containing protein [Desulfobacterales bacterium]
MNADTKNSLTFSKGNSKNRCLSCGTYENMARRKYCSIECRQKMRYALNLRTGLLKALNTRYATFYFTDSVIILNVLPYGSGELFSYLFPRTYGRKPVEDYCTMSNILGNAWWAEKNRTNKRYLATRFLLEKAESKSADATPIRPLEVREPVRLAKSLTFLKLNKSDLNSPELQKKIKSAYRKQAMQHHPDLGGDANAFRRLHDAYEQIIKWSENPTFIRRRGFPDKWFYDGSTNRWVQPAPRWVKL